jgi:hypothetical protein
MWVEARLAHREEKYLALLYGSVRKQLGRGVYAANKGI